MSEDETTRYARVDVNACWLVKGIENWISGIFPDGVVGDDCFLRMKDQDTGAVFLIKRIE